MRLSKLHFSLLSALIFLLALSPINTSAQSSRIKDFNQNAWFMYLGSNKLSDKWGLHTEMQLRRHDIVKDPQQLLLRTGLNYNITDNSMFTLGYGFIETYPYGEFPAADNFIEHRLYEQLQLKGNIARVGLTHRYRLEQRWVQSPVTSEYTYLNRARYMLRATLPLVGPTTEAKEPYLAVYDEVFVGFGNNIQRNIFDQNRAYVALGFKLSEAASVEAGYLNQIVQKPNGTVFEHNHTLQLGLFYNLNFSKKAE